MRVYKRLGELLIDQGLLSEDALQQAVTLQKKVGKPLGEVLVGMGVISWDDIYDSLSKQYGLKVLEDLPNIVTPDVLRMIPKPVADRLSVIPIEFDHEKGILKVVTTEVLRVPQIDRELSFLTGNKISTLLVPPPMFDALYKSSYDESASSEIIDNTFSIEQHTEIDLEDDRQDETDDTPVAKFINSLLDNGIRSDASDVHLEPYEKMAVARLRVDGVLRKVLSYPRKAHNSVVSRIKVMCKLDISEKRMPQDGKFYIRRGNEQFDMRVSTMPTIFGEKVVMRILRVSNAKKKLEDLGLSDHNRERFESIINAPYGIILVSGPTGSGKSTTLVAVLNQVTSEKVNVLTAEDPVEYTIEGISQCQVNTDIGLTFARYLRSFLRQDPDIIMVGEIRDRETAQLAIEASLTGHLVFSTIHTNSAAGAVARLVNMGVDPFLLGTSLIGVMGQRLVRKLCNNCKVKIPVREELRKMASTFYPDRNDFSEYIPGNGCPECRGMGYKGRTSISEILVVDNNLRQMIGQNASERELAQAAVKAGMRTLYSDGVQKVIDGVTSLEEIKRVAIEY
ncbi:GspE/PulE family protein [Mesotoga sp. B105.6.4]|uniref:GspE/PulE family protein n=1 Tax=Mesotoga sp. B105.6.4 TaxID=1582224 RepID=UPI000CBBB278|nr:GspE/PulE family protein [Mesotoga sp. B105.6.4]PNQ05519.1 general secretion pathway protein GspE [Mesotoga sp. SC_NapDC3]PNS40467.1 general secretion pathway protein GspE [Mesotoga sp. B105.6.4]PXF34605.1 general secretion pathway protein GspE [Mesotoga sp. SC_NapDC]